MEVKRLFYGDATSVGEARLCVRDALSETDAPEDVVDSERDNEGKVVWFELPVTCSTCGNGSAPIR